ncbi:MAG TPA: IPT/TIG domain-containing protein [Chitinophagaceae bacterium]|jgi:hypothetical protein|nr:IPT/TIG domain-containing protein [Chitinophagaceae bacterium]
MKSFYRKQKKITRTQFILSLFVLLAFIGCSKKDDPAPTPPVNNLELHSFTPTHALRGAVITLSGKKFSTITQNNHVRFAGTIADAAVLNSTPTELSVMVPATAVTGKISVTVGAETVVSQTDFIVDNAATLSITDFTPKQGTIGTVVTLTGQNFGNTIRVTLSGIEAQVTQKSATQIVFTIPANTPLASHRIRVESDGTPVESADDFTVVIAQQPAQWIRKNVNPTPTGIFQFGLSFVYKNKIYWGFSKLSFNQSHTDYMILDPAAADPQWILQARPPADMAPTNWQSGVAVVYNDKVYMGTGLTTNAINAWWEYHPETNTATRLADYPENTAHALAFSYFNKIYVGFGGNSKKLHEYDPVNNTWRLVTSTDLYEVNDASAFVIGNEAFIGRGLAGPGTLRKEFMRFGGSFLSPVTALPESIQSPETPSFTVNNKGYFVTGQKVWEYTPDATGGTWRKMIDTGAGPVIKHTAVVTVNGATVVYGWTSTGELFEFRIN